MQMATMITLLFMIIHFQVILSSEEVAQLNILERLDRIDAVQELNNLKIEQVETLFTGLKGKVERLEIKDKEMLEDLGKLDRKIADLTVSVSSLSLSKITEQRLQSKNGGLQFKLSGNEITIMNNPKTTAMPSTSKLTAPTLKSEIQDTAIISKQGHNEKVNYSQTTLKPNLASNITGFSQMKNDHGMCLAVLSVVKKRAEEADAQIIQAKCDPSKKGQNWKWDITGGYCKRFCNGWNFCLFNEKFNQKAAHVVHFHRIIDPRQHWIQKRNPGPVMNFEFCLAVDKDSNAHGAAIITTDCNPKEKGQRWTYGTA